MKKFRVTTRTGPEEIEADGYNISADGYLAFYKFIKVGSKMVRGFMDHGTVTEINNA
jgi:hypothetical protein